MGDLSRNFSRAEFACNCNCGMDTVDSQLITVLEQLRAHFKAPVTINSGNRCSAYNKVRGGAKNSFHQHSKAADIIVQGVDPLIVYNLLHKKYQISYGVGKSEYFTHIDVRPDRARWNY